MKQRALTSGHTRRATLHERGEGVPIGRKRWCLAAKVSEEGEGLRKLASGEVGGDHGVAEEGVAGVGGIEEAARVVNDCERALGGGGEGGTSCDESGEEVEVAVERVSEDEGVDLEKRGDALCSALEKV